MDILVNVIPVVIRKIISIDGKNVYKRWANKMNGENMLYVVDTGIS